MFKTLADAWKIPELRKKLIFTVLILLIYRIVATIPVPYVDIASLELANEAGKMTEGIFGLMNAMSGAAFSRGSVMALGIQPYINASIIIQLLTIAIPPLERLAKEGGEEGKKKIERITRYSTVALGLILGFAYFTMCNADPYRIMEDGMNFWKGALVVMVFAAGSSLAMWLGEQITEFGIGNGISMILFANIILSLPETMGQVMDLGWWAIAVVVIMAALVVFIVFINDAERRIPIQYAKRVVGRKIYGGQSTNLPIKVAMSGVMPVIFAQSIASIGATVMGFIPDGKEHFLYKYIFSDDCWVYAIVYFLLIFFFSWFYSTIQYDPTEISNNLKKNGGFIPGFRPGKPTGDFIKNVINKILIFGAIYLSIVALLPILGGIAARYVTEAIEAQKQVPEFLQNLQYLKGLAIGGTSIIIVVGVALETVKAIEAQMLMRHYKGFLD